MLQTDKVFSSFSANDLAAAQTFYSNILGLKVSNNSMGLQIELPGGGSSFIYEKKDHQPATFTVLNFYVSNIDTAVDELVKQGVVFEKYEGFGQDEKGIARGISAGRGPDIAWFKDPAGNILSVLHSQ